MTGLPEGSAGRGGYTLEAVRALIERMPHPASVTRHADVVAVNDALLVALGYRRDEFEGRAFTDFLPQEEDRFARREAARLRGVDIGYAPKLPVLVRAKDGSRRRFFALTTLLPAADGGVPLALSSLLELEGGDIDFADELVSIAERLFVERLEQHILKATIDGFERLGFRVGILERAGKVFTARAGASVEALAFHPMRAEQALAIGRPSFDASDAGSPEVSWAYVPVRADGAQYVMVLRGGHLGTHHVSGLSLFARHLSAALTNARLIADLERRDSENRLLLDFVRATSSTLELSSLFDVACDVLVKLLDVSSASVLLLDEKARTLKSVAASAEQRVQGRGMVHSLDSQCLGARAAREKKTFCVEDVSLLPAEVASSCPPGARAVLALPLLARTEVIGAVVLSEASRTRTFGPELLELAEAMVGQLGLSVANARLYESLKENYGELARTRAQMVKSERLAALGELAAIIAHEVRNPLGVIFNAVSSLKRVVKRDADGTMLLDIVREESDRLNRIVGDLLDFARPREPSLQPEDLGPVLQDAVTAGTPPPASSGPVFLAEVEVEADLPPVHMDRRLFRQGIVNLVMNACQAMPKGGRVRVAARREQGRAAGEDWVRVEISDEGVGLSADVVHRIFEPFFTTKAKGTGLGLAVVKRIIEDHGGRIEVSSTPGRGTTFLLFLPLAQPRGME